MNNSTIAKSLLGVALTGGAVAGISYSILPKSKQAVSSNKLSETEELMAEQKRRAVFKKRREYRAGIMKKIFAKYAGNETAKTEIAEAIGGKSGARVTIFAIKEDGNFYEDDLVSTTVSGWCEISEYDKKTLEKYPDVKREEICKEEV